MKTKKVESLSRQIESTRRKVEQWPDWMKSIAYFSVISASPTSTKASTPTPPPKSAASKS